MLYNSSKVRNAGFNSRISKRALRLPQTDFVGAGTTKDEFSKSYTRMREGVELSKDEAAIPNMCLWRFK